jgi:hypothetical protein
LAVFLWALNKRKKGELPWQQDSRMIAEAQEVNDVIDTTRTEDGGSELQESH